MISLQVELKQLLNRLSDNKTLSKGDQRRLTQLWKLATNRYFGKILRNTTLQANRRLKKSLSRYVDSGWKQDNKGLLKQNIIDLKPNYRRLMEDKIKYSTSLIKTRSDEAIKDMQAQLLNTLNNKQLMNSADFQKNLVKPKFNTRSADFIIRDQNTKFLASLDEVTAMQNKAIAFIWNAFDDSKTRPEHRKRDGNIYFLDDSWAIQDGLIKQDVPKFSSIEDTTPAQEINCRCRLSSIYSIKDISKQYLTKEGKLVADR